MQEATVLSQRGNSKGKAKAELNDTLFFKADENQRIILTKAPAPKQGTLEYLFKDYADGSFQTEPINLGAPVGNEQW